MHYETVFFSIVILFCFSFASSKNFLQDELGEIPQIEDQEESTGRERLPNYGDFGDYDQMMNGVYQTNDVSKDEIPMAGHSSININVIPRSTEIISRPTRNHKDCTSRKINLDTNQIDGWKVTKFDDIDRMTASDSRIHDEMMPLRNDIIDELVNSTPDEAPTPYFEVSSLIPSSQELGGVLKAYSDQIDQTDENSLVREIVEIRHARSTPQYKNNRPSDETFPLEGLIPASPLMAMNEFSRRFNNQYIPNDIQSENEKRVLTSSGTRANMMAVNPHNNYNEQNIATPKFQPLINRAHSSSQGVEYPLQEISSSGILHFLKYPLEYNKPTPEHATENVRVPAYNMKDIAARNSHLVNHRDQIYLGVLGELLLEVPSSMPVHLPINSWLGRPRKASRADEESRRLGAVRTAGQLHRRFEHPGDQDEWAMTAGSPSPVTHKGQQTSLNDELAVSKRHLGVELPDFLFRPDTLHQLRLRLRMAG